MKIERPDLSNATPEIRTYIESLEAEIARFQKPEKPLPDAVETDKEDLRPSEPPTTINIITFSGHGAAKRTPRHLYAVQRRGGMGVFGLDAPEDDIPACLCSADESQSILLFTSQARAFRLPVSFLAEAPVHSRGQGLKPKVTLDPTEIPVAALPFQAKGAIALVSRQGMVRYLRHHVFGEHMKPGTSMFNPAQFGPLAAVCVTSGDDDLFIATQKGRAIRFSEKLVPPQGGQGIRLEDGDEVVAITAVQPESGVLLVDSVGRGTIRLMAGFAPNKSAGGSGKLAMSTDTLVAAITVEEGDDIFLISRLAKIIRFGAAEIPAKEGVVQGVNCMALRADAVVAAAISQR